MKAHRREASFPAGIVITTATETRPALTEEAVVVWRRRPRCFARVRGEGRAGKSSHQCRFMLRTDVPGW